MKTEYKLKRPIVSTEAKKIDTLFIRRTNIDDLDAIDSLKQGVKQQRTLIMRLAELSPEDTGKIDVYDYNKISDIIAGFFDDADGQTEAAA